MHVFFLTTEFPWPQRSGGTARTLEQVSLLASLPEVSRVALFSLCEGEVPEAARAAMREAIPKLWLAAVVPHPIRLRAEPRRVPSVVWKRLLGMPYLVAKFHNASMRRQLASLSREHRPSCVYVDHLAMMHLVPDVFGRPRVVLGQHNAEYEFFAQFEREKKGLLRRVAAWERRAAEAYERAALLRADATVAIGERDRDTFARLAGIQAFVVRPAMVPRPRRAGPSPDQPMAFGYVGHLTWRPNVEGLDWLVRRVWPTVRAALPNATLELTGAGLAPDHVPAAWRAPGVTVSGLVLDLEELYGRTHAMVAPVRGGAGVRMKVLEALRSGMPLVASSDALEGMGLRHEEHLLSATEPKMFADCMVRLASDVDLRERLVASARSYVMRRHSVEGALPVLRRALGLPV